MNHRIAIYRVYFTVEPDKYHVVATDNAHVAILRAKRSQRAFRLNIRRQPPLIVAKIERLDKAGVRQLKIAD